MAKLRSLPRVLAAVAPPDTKWEITSILVSLSTFLFPLSLSFWAMWVSLDGGRIMLPSTVASTIFASLAALCFIAWIVVTVYTLRVLPRWYKESATTRATKGTSQEVTELRADLSRDIAELRADLNSRLDNLSSEIHSLVSEIRQERNEQSSEPK